MIQHGIVLLAVAQYYLTAHRRRTEHWALVAVSPKSSGVHVFHVVGNTDSFAFQATYEDNIFASSTLCGGCVVGKLPVEKVESGWLTEQLRQLPVIRYDPNWDSQDWVLDAIRVLKDHTDCESTIIDQTFTERGLRAALREERNGWESGEDHYFERVLPRMT